MNEHPATQSANNIMISRRKGKLWVAINGQNPSIVTNGAFSLSPYGENVKFEIRDDHLFGFSNERELGRKARYDGKPVSFFKPASSEAWPIKIQEGETFSDRELTFGLEGLPKTQFNRFKDIKKVQENSPYFNFQEMADPHRSWRPMSPRTEINLETLTDHYRCKMANLPLPEQTIVFEIVALQANYPLGKKFKLSELFSPLGSSLQPNEVGAYCTRLSQRNVLQKTYLNEFETRAAYSLHNPAFELWARVHFFGMNQPPYTTFFQGDHPLLLQDTAHAPDVFWKKICEQAGVNGDKLPIRRRSPMPELAA